RVTWLVDPLDGTSNYAHGVPFACTSVAVRDAEGLAAGAILDPFREELFTAARGGGAWLGDESLAVSAVDSPQRALVCTGLQSDDPEAIAAFGRRIVALSRECRGVRCVGSPALCLAYVAAGRIDAFLERDATYAWDVGAGGLMIAEAGGRIEALDGGPLNLGRGLANVLASNRHIHEALADVVRAAEQGTGSGGTTGWTTGPDWRGGGVRRAPGHGAAGPRCHSHHDRPDGGGRLGRDLRREPSRAGRGAVRRGRGGRRPRELRRAAGGAHGLRPDRPRRVGPHVRGQRPRFL